MKVVFFFDGATPESKRDTWKQRRQCKVNNMVKIFENLGNNLPVQEKHLDGMLPSLVSATGPFVAKYVSGCDVHISVSDCDEEMACFAQKEDCFAILSQDTDFVILEGARHFLTVKELNLKTMTTHAYCREGLLNSLGLEPQQLCLLASLLGNCIVPVTKLKNFHNRLKRAQNGRELPNVVADYVKQWEFSTSYDDEELRKIANDVFGDDNMAHDLETSLQSYLSPSTETQEGTAVADMQVSERRPVITLKCPV